MNNNVPVGGGECSTDGEGTCAEPTSGLYGRGPHANRLPYAGCR